jgi:hypothetical protein
MANVVEFRPLGLYEKSMRDCEPGRPYTVPDRSKCPLENFWELPAREYLLYMKAQSLFGERVATTLANRLGGRKHAFLTLDAHDKRNLESFLEQSLVTLPD